MVHDQTQLRFFRVTVTPTSVGVYRTSHIVLTTVALQSTYKTKDYSEYWTGEYPIRVDRACGLRSVKHVSRYKQSL